MKGIVVVWVIVSSQAWGCSRADNGADATGGSSGGGTTSALGGATSATGGTAGVTFSGCLGDIAWYAANIESVKGEGFYSPTSPGQKSANAYGLYDMLGNAAEWTADCLHDTYVEAPDDGSVWSATACEYYMMRGGCSSQAADLLRASTRSGVDPTGYGSCNVGLRCAANATSVLTSAAADFTWIDLEGGTYDMGCSPGDGNCDDNELPVHRVTLAAFKLMAKEVTQLQYFNLTGTTTASTECADCSNTAVPYGDAKAFCEGLGGRLPSEAEWEYAARAGTKTRYYCGN